MSSLLLDDMPEAEPVIPFFFVEVMESENAMSLYRHNRPTNQTEPAVSRRAVAKGRGNCMRFFYQGLWYIRHCSFGPEQVWLDVHLINA